MQVFKAACKITLRHPVYLVIYIMLLSLLGLFLVGSLFSDEAPTSYQANRPTIAVIDHDQSALSGQLKEILHQHADFVEVGDDEQELQDAVAQELASYILIIPDGYSDAFEHAAKQKVLVPELTTIISYTSVYGTLIDQITNQYFTFAQGLIAAEPGLALNDIAVQAKEAMQSMVEVDLVKTGDATPIPVAYNGFLKFSAYPLTVGIIVCVSMMMGAFNRGEIRRRTVSSPLSNISFNMQTALGCIMIALFAWAWINLLGLGFFGAKMEAVPWENIALIFLVVLAFVTVPLALGYLFAQLGLRENVANAAGNILALILSFLGGIWVELEFLGEEMLAVAHFTPAYWYGDAITRIAELTSTPSAEVLAAVAGNIGIMLLFSVAIFVVALVVGRMRMQSAEAGGNTAAARLYT